MKGLHKLLFSFTILLVVSNIFIARHTLFTRNQPLSNNQTLVSLAETFELGFFSPEKSTNWYLGIWFKNIPVRTIVWVVNKETPFTDPSGQLMIDDNGSLVILTQTKDVIWSSLNHSIVQNRVAQLLDSGNLVLKAEGNDGPGSFIWQSFDYPTDTLLEGMKLGWDLRKGLNRQLTSWKSTDNPSAGEFTYVMEPTGFPELVLLRGSNKLYGSGPWNGVRFCGTSALLKNQVFTPMLVSIMEETYYIFALKDNSTISIFLLHPCGLFQRHLWNDRSQEWSLMMTKQDDRCDNFGLCGVL